MPNRIIREGWIESEAVAQLDASAERFLLRLMLRADDFGRYHANPLLLKSALFPLSDGIRSTDMTRWLAACESAGLVRCYTAEGKAYVAIRKFDQRTRAQISKFPAPPSNDSHPRADDGHMTVICQSSDGHPRTETETYSEANTETETNTETELVGSLSASAPAAKDQKPEKVEQTDEQWLAELTADSAYAHVSIPTEWAKMHRWCAANRKQPTRRRFINWINRIDRPVAAPGTRTAAESARVASLLGYQDGL